MNKRRSFLTSLATAFVVTFIVLWTITLILPGCFWLSLGIYLACSSGSWLAITLALIITSIVISVAWATIVHWFDRT